MPKFRVTKDAGKFFRHEGRAYQPGDVLEMSVDTAAGFPRALQEVKQKPEIRNQKSEEGKKKKSTDD